MSTRIPRKAPTMRKEPRQARSKATVNAIIEAGTQVLGKQGWMNFTTNEVAAAAGVSIGSLYQYFPDKLALVEAIRRSHFEDVLGVVRDAGDAPVESGIETLVQGMLRIHGSHPALHRALLEEIPRTTETSKAHDAFEAQYLRLYRTLVARHRKRNSASSLEMATQVISAAVEGVVHHAALGGLLDSPTLKGELIALVDAYLRA